MATDPNVLKTAKEHAKELDKLLASVSDNSDVINENFNLAAKVLAEAGKSVGSLNKEFGEFTSNIAEDLRKCTTAEERILTIQQKQFDIQEEIERLQRLATTGALVGNEITFYTNLQKILASASKEQSSALLRQVFLGKRLNQHYGNILTITKNLPGKLQMVGNALGKMGPIAGSVGKVLTGIGVRMAALGVPIIGWIVAAALLIKDLAIGIYTTFKNADTAAEKLRMTLGITRDFTSTIDKNARHIAINFAHVGVTFEKAYESVIAIVQTMGSLTGYSSRLVETTSIFASQLGVSAEKSTQTLKAFAQIARTTMTAQRNMLYFVGSLSQAAGTNLGEVMGDIADFAQSNYRFMSRSVLEMAKAAVEARRMGTSLASAGKSASTLLNFTQSINDEMEASVLLGKSVNLQRARTLAYSKDIVGLNREILKLAQDADFENMDPFQMQAFAKALGKTEDELAKILQSERERMDMERAAATDPNLRKQLETYNKLKDANEAIAEASAKDYENKLKTQANQQRIVALQNTWNQMVQRLAEEWLPIIDDTIKQLIPAVKLISSVLVTVMDPIVGALKIVAGLLKAIFSLATFNGEGIKNGLEIAGRGVIKTMFGWIDKTQGYMVEGFRKSSPEMTNALIEPFENLHELYLKASSPHKLGRLFIEGFEKSVPFIERSLNKPFEGISKSLLNIEKESTIPFRSMSEEIDAIANRISQLSGEITLNETNRPAPVGIGTPFATRGFNEPIDRFSANNDGLMKVVESINRLREDMLSGRAIATVNMDSQKLDMVTKRSTRFRGGFGVNDANANNYS